MKSTYNKCITILETSEKENISIAKASLGYGVSEDTVRKYLNNTLKK
jgi:response regulator of citrate/malate metabolism